MKKMRREREKEKHKDKNNASQERPDPSQIFILEGREPKRMLLKEKP